MVVGDVRRLLTKDGSEIVYQVVGSGEPLFLLHGNYGSSNYFSHQKQVFAENYQVFLVDSRGHGASSNCQPTLDFFQMADDLKAVCQQERITKLNLLGYSDGANIAMVFAVKYGSMVNKLILNAGNVTFKGLKPLTRWKSQLAYALCQGLSRIWRFPRKFLPFLKLIVSDIGISYDDLKKIVAPTLVLVGAHDIVRLAESQTILQHLAAGQLTEIAGGTHRLARQMPKLFNRLCLAFLKA